MNDPAAPEPRTRRRLEIAVGVPIDADGRVLIAKRRPGTPGAGKWEFPGGKREAGESMAAALARELAEELGVTVTASRPLIRFSHDYRDREVLLDIYLVTDWRGDAHGREGQQIAWSATSALFDYDLLAANKPVADALRLPATYVITPAPQGDDDAFIGRIETLLAAGARLLRLRAPALADADYERLARQVQARARLRGAALLLDRDAAMAARVGAAGLHWPVPHLRTGARPLPAKQWFAVSCHNRDELRQALAAGADFATLSPVAATASHPHTPPLGWAGFNAARADLPLPIYALGGLGAADLEAAWTHGAQGVAGIRALWPAQSI